MSPPCRIVSLIASATEIVCALGLEDQLVGISHECDYPPGIRHLPVCSEPRIDVHADSRTIDQQVKQSLKEALSIYRVFTEELDRLQPTHILTQSQCEVCAVSLKDVQQAVCHLIGSQPEILSCQPLKLTGLWNDIREIADALDVPARGRKLIDDLQQELMLLQQRSRFNDPPRVLCLEWLDPMMSAGNWVPELVEMAGGIPLLSRAGEHSPYFIWDDLERADPDLIVTMPCGFDLSRTISEFPLLKSQSRWNNLRAVRTGRVYMTDGNQYFNRPGPRLVDSAKILAEIFCDAASPDSSDCFYQDRAHEGPSHGNRWQRLG